MNTLPQQFITNLQKKRASLTERLSQLHDIISIRYPFVHRLAMALYDPETDLLKTFISSNSDGERLVGYEAKLGDVPSLKSLADERKSRVVNDINGLFNSEKEHTTWLKAHHYQSSYTQPLFQGEHLSGFMFFDSRSANVFTAETTSFLDVFAELTSELYLLELRAMRSLIGTVQVASGLAKIRDLETGNHLQRIANYARLIAKKIANHFELDDEFIEYLHLFAPLHDIGKVGMPDDILLKPGRLLDDEWVIMRQHVELGEKLIAQLIDELGLEEGIATSMMRNVVAYHHERCDGSGYPRGLTDHQIPIEAKIIAVADVYDSLAHRRPYKQPWTEVAILAELKEEAASGKLDPVCVDAILNSPTEFSHIRHNFPD
ncbi:HD domain-containing protein [Leeia sp. TBRC 13508]|uniref:HD domain-containing protein n=1 Tax=Leeia speluncae TaxID=2884804 RepID=A0ABS8D3Z7_9NEIS|nr:HD domain-containing phosphohydrolase [Leeia speluncae]MCB6182917.1 HD domain-containing protein [Leeia speluncae]